MEYICPDMHPSVLPEYTIFQFGIAGIHSFNKNENLTKLFDFWTEKKIKKKKTRKRKKENVER